jgi:hypothetical protein
VQAAGSRSKTCSSLLRLKGAVGFIDKERKVVGEKGREEWARGLVFEDAILGAQLARQR